MIRSVIIDDELLSIEKVKYILQGFSNIEVIGEFMDPYQALEEIPKQAPRLIFLDIEMPGINGLDLAERILNTSPQADVVFVTAHDDYALNAFEIAAIDYLLKPVTRERMAKTLSRIILKAEENKTPLHSSQDQIFTFGDFEVKAVGYSHSVKWRTVKVKELFAYLLAEHGRSVKKDIIMADLWPDMNNKKALANLNTCIYQVRKTICEAGLDISVIYEGGCYRMELGNIYLDNKNFELLLNDVDQIQQTNANMIQDALTLYKGGYFEFEGYSWAIQKQEWYFNKYKKATLALARYYYRKKFYDKALHLLEQLTTREPFSEEGWELMIKVCIQKGDKAKASKLYRKMEDIFVQQLGIRPRKEIKRIIAN